MAVNLIKLPPRLLSRHTCLKLSSSFGASTSTKHRNDSSPLDDSKPKILPGSSSLPNLKFSTTSHDFPPTDDSREKWLTVPNALCVSRIVAAPYLSHLVIAGEYNLACGLFIAAGATDLLDGAIARRFPSQQSAVGTALDPFADKVLVAALFASLTYVNLVPASLMALVIGRDVILVAYSMTQRYQMLDAPKTWSRYWDPNNATVHVTPTTISKANTAMQLTLAASTLLAAAVGSSDSLLLCGMCYITAATTVASGLSYFVAKNTYKVVSRGKRK